MLSNAFPSRQEADGGQRLQDRLDNYFPRIGQYYATAKGELQSFPSLLDRRLLLQMPTPSKRPASRGRRRPGRGRGRRQEAEGRGLRLPDGDQFRSLVLAGSVLGDPQSAGRHQGQRLSEPRRRSRLQQDQVVDEIKFWKKQADEKLFVRQDPSSSAWTRIPAFSSQTCQMAMSSIADHGTVGKTMPQGVEWHVAMLPVFEGTRARSRWVGGASLWVMKDRPQASTRARPPSSTSLAQPDMVEWWSTVTGYIPVTKSRLPGDEGQRLLRQAAVHGPRARQSRA